MYRLALEYQAKVFSPDTVRLLSTCDAFNTAKSVLDVGCGPGLLVKEFKHLLHGKEYLGIDLQDDFIQHAKTLHPDLNFRTADLFDLKSEKVDVIVLYAVLQHLEDPKKALSHLKNRLTENGAFIIMGTKVSVKEFESTPHLPILTKMYEDLQALEQSSGRNKNSIFVAEEWARENKIETLQSQDVETHVNSVEEKSTYLQYAMYVSEMLKRYYDIQTDQIALKAELESWAQLPDSTATIYGGSWLVLQNHPN